MTAKHITFSEENCELCVLCEESSEAPCLVDSNEKADSRIVKGRMLYVVRNLKAAFEFA